MYLKNIIFMSCMKSKKIGKIIRNGNFYFKLSTENFSTFDVSVFEVSVELAHWN